jgi:hypothetical protein
VNGRIPCINPQCRRTAPSDKYAGSTEIVCYKCFRALPADIRNEHRRIWREIRKWERRILRTSDEIKIGRMHSILGRLGLQLDRNWRQVREGVMSPQRPEGLDNFMQEIGL